ISGGNTILQGAAFHNGLSTVTGGRLIMNGVLFRGSGTDVTIDGGTVSLWGNIGNGGFEWSGAPASASYNVPR
ncbi:MAG TPA: hypothetical protein VKP08_00720, partial [Anaerolineales bacterium]|nr:hypothetical protein [Anaerolineales bacterium]